MNQLLHLLLFPVVSFTVLSTLISYASAIVIDPLAIKISENAGEIVNGKISVRNEHNEPIWLTVFLTDMSLNQDTYPGWISLSKNELYLEALSTKDLNYTVTLPKNGTGQFLTKISFAEKYVKQSSTTRIQTRVSIYLAADIKGTERYSAKIKEIQLNNANPQLIEIAVENQGNVYLKLIGEGVIFEKSTYRLVAKFTINKKLFSVFPGRTRKLSGHIPGKLKPGNYLVSVFIPIPEIDDVISKCRKLTIPETSK